MTIETAAKRPLLRASVAAIFVMAFQLLVGGQAQSRGTISGQVVAAGATQLPVRRAVVVLAASGHVQLTTIADEEGRFVFDRVPTGYYTIRASRPPYIPSSYGSRRPGGLGTPVRISDGDRVDGLKVELALGGVITGQVRNVSGRGIEGVRIAVVQTESTELIRANVAPDAILTDDRGQYRAFGLSPGEYFVVAIPSIVGSGGITSLSSSEIDQRLRELASGSGLIHADPQQIGRGGQVSARPSYLLSPIFYPGVPRALEASRIRVDAGETQSGVDITLAMVPVATITGTVVGVGGGPVENVTLWLSGDGPEFSPMFGAIPVLTMLPDGRFRFSNVPAGHYVLWARGLAARPEVARVGTTGFVASDPGNPAPVSWSKIEIDVAGVDLDGLQLQLRSTLKVRGRLLFDGAASPADVERAAIRVWLESVRERSPLPVRKPVDGIVSPTGSFEFPSVLPGSYRLASASRVEPSVWWLRSAVVGGRDVLDAPLDIDEDIAELTLTLSNRPTGIAGRLLDQTGRWPVAEYSVIAFPEDRSLWRAGPRRMRTTRLASDGRFQIVALPPGAYLLAVIASDETTSPFPASLLAEVIPSAVRVTVAEGLITTQDLRLR